MNGGLQGELIGGSVAWLRSAELKRRRERARSDQDALKKAAMTRTQSATEKLMTNGLFGPSLKSAKVACAVVSEAGDKYAGTSVTYACSLYTIVWDHLFPNHKGEQTRQMKEEVVARVQELIKGVIRAFQTSVRSPSVMERYELNDLFKKGVSPHAGELRDRINRPSGDSKKILAVLGGALKAIEDPSFTEVSPELPGDIDRYRQGA